MRAVKGEIACHDGLLLGKQNTLWREPNSPISPRLIRPQVDRFNRRIGKASEFFRVFYSVSGKSIV